jgi:hypothetical protein
LPRGIAKKGLTTRATNKYQQIQADWDENLPTANIHSVGVTARVKAQEVVGAHISIGDLFALLMYPELGILFYKNTIWNIYARDTLATRTLHRLARGEFYIINENM